VKRAATVLGLVLWVLPACGQDEGGSPGELREETASALEDVPLQEEEVPEGLEPNDAATGPIRSLREVLPPRSLLPNLPPLPAQLSEAFRGGFETAYRRGEDRGPASVASSAIRFSGPDPASGFVAYLREVQVGAGRGPERMEVPVSSLGEEAFGWHTAEPLGESSTVVWRTGDLVLTVSAGGSIGSAPPERTVALARTVQRRTAS